MSFLRKHWQITLPLSLLFLLSIGIGGILLYGHINARALVVDNITYAMPERSADPPKINTGTAGPIPPQAYKQPAASGNGKGDAPSQPADTSPTKPTAQPLRDPELATDSVPSNDDPVDAPAVPDFSEQDNQLATMESELKKMETDAADVFAAAWDNKAEELRPLSLADRRAHLDAIRAEVSEGEDPEDEFIEIFMNQFISAMNDRGVYFE